MRATLRLPRGATYVDYLALERNSERQHELIDGVIVAVAGGSLEHNAIAGRIAGLLNLRLARGCRYYTPEQRVWIAASGRARYTDGAVICGRPVSPPHDEQACVNPTLVIEVLSPTTEGDDEGDKRLDFQTLASLRAYVLVAQDARAIRIYRRTGDGWDEPTLHRSGESVELPGLTAAVAVDEIYDDILDANGRTLLR